ncbi:50S ribosome-binding GTPase, partial [bacterium]|nr:50S ribosome-binding GTPase [bacterium]
MTKNSQSIPRVVIFGSTNVGKSTLFNCLVERYQALISDIEGTTRDSIYGTVSWQGRKFTLIDTGGIIDANFLSRKKTKVKETDINALVQKQACEHIAQADLILFLVDIRHGLLPTDKQMALKLKKMFSDTAHIILVANKADSPRLR